MSFLSAIRNRSERPTHAVGASPQQSVREEQEADLSVGEGVPRQFRVGFFAERMLCWPWNVETRLGLRCSINFLEGKTHSIKMQKLEVIQGVIQSVVLVEATTHQISEVEEIRMNKGPGSTAEDDRLELGNRKEEGELDKVGNELEAAKEEG